MDTTTAVGELVFHMIGSIAQFERMLISERITACSRGRSGGCRVKMLQSNIKKANAMLLDPDATKTEVAKHFNVSRPTFFLLFA